VLEKKKGGANTAPFSAITTPRWPYPMIVTPSVTDETKAAPAEWAEAVTIYPTARPGTPKKHIIYLSRGLSYITRKDDG
jgi:hypothetical protein